MVSSGSAVSQKAVKPRMSQKRTPRERAVAGQELFGPRSHHRIRHRRGQEPLQPPHPLDLADLRLDPVAEFGI